MRTHLLFPALILFIFSCDQQDKAPVAIKKIDSAWLDSIIKNSDSSYSKPYKRTDFVTAYFYVSKKDSSVCQLMKDSAGVIRQVLIAKKGTRIFFAQYYSNGQLQASLPLDESGQYHGPAAYYFNDGFVQSSGTYTHGLKSGQWKEYKPGGKPSAIVSYDKNGQPLGK